MATSSNFSTSNQYIKYRIVVTETSTSIPNNTSTVNVKVQAWRTNTGYTTYGTGTCYCTINGTSYSQSISSSQTITHNSYTTLFERNVTIAHNTDGSKSIYVSAYISHARFSSSSNGFTVALTTLPRKAEITDAPNFYDTANPVISYSNPAGSVVTTLQACISLDNSADTIAYRDINKSGTSYTFELTDAERNALLNATPNSNTLTVYFIVKTVLSGTTYYSSVQKTMTVTNAAPTVSGITYEDTNATTLAITGDDQQIIQGQSTLRFNFGSIQAKKGATLSQLVIEINAYTIFDTISGSSMSNYGLTFGQVDSASNETANIRIVDSRGNTVTAAVSITVLAWSLPTAVISLARKANYYDETYLTVNADYSSLDGNNTISIQYQYKEKGAGSYGALVSIQDEVTVTLSLDNTKVYDFKIIVTDSIGTATYNTTLRSGIPILFIDRLRRSVGVGTIPDQDNMFVADRRISLMNLLHERVADLWSWSSGGTRSASLYIYNQDSKTVADLKGRATGGYVTVYDPTGVAVGYIYSTGSGGALWLANSSGNNIANIYSSSTGGCFLLKNNSDNKTVEMVTSSGSDGTINVYDSSGQYTINLSGQSGKITCISLVQTSSRKVKENIEELGKEEAYKILELVAVTFDYINKNRGINRRGFIAEDVAEIIPELVTPETDETTASIDYIEMIPYLQSVIKDQEKRIQALEKKLEELTK